MPTPMPSQPEPELRVEPEQQLQAQAEPQRARIKDLLAAEEAGVEAMIKGWVKTVRSSGGRGFCAGE